MSCIVRENEITIIELGPKYDPLDDQALSEFGGILLAEATHAEPPRLVLDFSRTTFIGSSFIELLVRAWKRLKERGGTMALCGVQPFCLEILEVTRLTTIWNIYPTREEALEAIRRS